MNISEIYPRFSTMLNKPKTKVAANRSAVLALFCAIEVKNGIFGNQPPFEILALFQLV